MSAKDSFQEARYVEPEETAKKLEGFIYLGFLGLVRLALARRRLGSLNYLITCNVLALGRGAESWRVQADLVYVYI